MAEEKDTTVEEKKDGAEVAEEAPKEKEDAPAAPADTPEEGEPVSVPAQFKKLVEEIETMSVLELNELVKVLEKKFGVSASAVAVAAPGAAGTAEGADEEQSTFSVELTGAGDQKIAVIKAVKGMLGLGLKEAKDMVDGVPSMLKEGVSKTEAEEMKTKLEEAGGTVTLK